MKNWLPIVLLGAFIWFNSFVQWRATQNRLEVIKFVISAQTEVLKEMNQ